MKYLNLAHKDKESTKYKGRSFDKVKIEKYLCA